MAIPTKPDNDLLKKHKKKKETNRTSVPIQFCCKIKK